MLVLLNNQRKKLSLDMKHSMTAGISIRDAVRRCCNCRGELVSSFDIRNLDQQYRTVGFSILLEISDFIFGGGFKK